MRDVIVVGARCAGAPTAMLLARKGYDVLLVDRSTFPSEIPHGHFIHRHGPQRLARWGLLDRIVARGCPVTTSSTLDLGDYPLESTDLIEDGVAFGIGPRRSLLDTVLVDGAGESGAEVRQGFVVDEFTGDGERITGISGRERGSRALSTERARIIVGADGRNSSLARTVQAELRHSAPTCTCWYFSYWSDVQTAGLEVYARADQVIFAFPTNDNLFAVFAAWPRNQLGTIRTDIEAHFLAALDRIPGLGERVRAGKHVERFLGATDLPNFIRKPFGPGWALVGDAGCHKDPYMALGICDAFRDAELLARAIDEGLSGKRPFEEALADHERQRNEETEADYHLNLHQAQYLPQSPEVLQIRAVLRNNPAAATLFTKVLEGLVPRDRFFNPENLAALTGKAAPAAAPA